VPKGMCQTLASVFGNRHGALSLCLNTFFLKRRQ
jgi:hypothetical protein